jgi:hypothetical protein
MMGASEMGEKDTHGRYAGGMYFDDTIPTFCK